MGLGDNPYKPHSSFLDDYKDKRGRRTLLTFTTLLTPQHLRFFTLLIALLLPFHTEKGEIFIGPNGFRIEAKKCHIPRIYGTDGTIIIIGRYHRLVWRYHRLTELSKTEL